MAVNLLDMAKGYLTDAFVSRVSGSLKEDPEGIQKALTGALPVFLAGMISRSNNPDGPGLLTNLIERFTPGSVTAPQTPVIDEDDPDTLISKGSALPEAIFGANTATISGALAQFSGVETSSAASLLSMAGSIITGLISRQLAGQGVNTTTLLSLLGDQREAVASAMPVGLSSLMSASSGADDISSLLGGLSGAASSPVTGVAGAISAAVAGATNTPPPISREIRERVASTPAYNDTLNDRSKGFNVWPWLLAALAAGLLFYFMRGCGDTTDTIATTANDTTSASVPDATANADTVASTASAAVDSASSALATAADSVSAAAAASVNALGAFSTKKLPDGIELNLPANGVENKLIAFIEDNTKVVDKTTWFNFDRLLYETGSATLKPESREQLQNIAAILKAYPAVNLKIGGYTDNKGGAAANKKLSQSRAESVVTELSRLGVDPARLEAEGYGQENPAASNNTEAGRAQNRRTAVRVTKK